MSAAARPSSSIHGGDILAAVLLWPLAALLGFSVAFGLFNVGSNAAQDPHRTLWRIGLFLFIGLVWLFGLPGVAFARSRHRGDHPLRQLNWLAGGVLVTGMVGIPFLVILTTI